MTARTVPDVVRSAGKRQVLRIARGHVGPRPFRCQSNAIPAFVLSNTPVSAGIVLLGSRLNGQILPDIVKNPKDSAG